jgi:hypothetical protein
MSPLPFGMSREPFGMSREPFGLSREPFGLSREPLHLYQRGFIDELERLRRRPANARPPITNSATEVIAAPATNDLGR